MIDADASGQPEASAQANLAEQRTDEQYRAFYRGGLLERLGAIRLLGEIRPVAKKTVLLLRGVALDARRSQRERTAAERALTEIGVPAKYELLGTPTAPPLIDVNELIRALLSELETS